MFNYAHAQTNECVYHDFSVAEDYFEKKRDLQEPDFNSYILEDQYKIFIYGNTCVHPPFVYLANLLAQKGEAVIGFLKQKLHATEDDATVISILDIFWLMNRRQTYEVAEDNELMTLIEHAIRNMRGENSRAHAQEILETYIAPERKIAK